MLRILCMTLLAQIPSIESRTFDLKLAPRYQNLYTMNNGSYKGWISQHIADLEARQFSVSGGMAGVQVPWKSVKEMELPAGAKITVWSENTDVRAFALVPRWRWSFPVGTILTDTISVGDKVFTIRRRAKLAEGWHSFVIYRDDDVEPAGYRGGESCNTCHSQAADVLDVPRRVYRRVRWGDDTVFSWRPFLDNGQLDHSYPLDVKSGK